MKNSTLTHPLNLKQNGGKNITAVAMGGIKYGARSKITTAVYIKAHI